MAAPRVAAVLTVLAVIGAASAALAADGIDSGATAFDVAVRIGGDSGPTVADCPVFPADNAWNQDISSAPLHPRSASIIASIQSNGTDNLHPDFGSNPDYGIPYVVVPPTQPSGADRLRRLRRRERSRPVPDPARRTDRGCPGSDIG